ncbi:transposase [Streptomyces sp. DG2A-72]|uniref:transposase n=1 Tax=Streptomyces sp. DG2A-72 TaxID=3051386 RepID=UPI00265C2FF0|nr:transposase [Streptomyces sp. DG2A-72]MDO0930329.1 transposase [Streptomyces sp. DG2A-72]
MGRIAGRFARVEPRRRTGRLVLGLLSDLPRKNCWSIAEWAGEAGPDGMQHLLGRVKWDADAVRDDVREYVLEHLHDEDAVLVVDETGDVKKGTHTVGVQRQYAGTAGTRISISVRQRGVGGSLRYDSVSGRSRCRSCSAGQVRSDPAALR